MQRPHYMIGLKRQLLEEAAGRHSVELCSEWEAFPRNQLINYLAFSHAPVGTCRGQRSMPIVFPSHSPHNAFKQDLLLNQALTFGGRLTDQKAPGTPFFLLPFPSPSPRVIGVCCHAQCIYGNWDPNSCPQVCATDTLPSKLFPEPLAAISKDRERNPLHCNLEFK